MAMSVKGHKQTSAHSCVLILPRKEKEGLAKVLHNAKFRWSTRLQLSPQIFSYCSCASEAIECAEANGKD